MGRSEGRSHTRIECRLLLNDTRADPSDGASVLPGFGIRGKVLIGDGDFQHQPFGIRSFICVALARASLARSRQCCGSKRADDCAIVPPNGVSSSAISVTSFRQPGTRMSRIQNWRSAQGCSPAASASYRRNILAICGRIRVQRATLWVSWRGRWLDRGHILPELMKRAPPTWSVAAAVDSLVPFSAAASRSLVAFRGSVMTLRAAVLQTPP
jgi:hypothetical protein